MKEFTYTITDPEGIHARPAGELVKVAKEFSCKITLTKDGKSGDCKKIFGIFHRSGAENYDTALAFFPGKCYHTN